MLQGMKNGTAGQRARRLSACVLMASGTMSLAAGQEGDEDQVKGRIMVTRQDLAELVQSVDELYAAGKRLPAEGELSAEAVTQLAFDELSLDFLRFRTSAAFKKLDAMRVTLGGGDNGLVDELRLELGVDERWVRRMTFTHASAPADGMHTFRIRSVRPLDDFLGKIVPFEFWESWEGPKGATFAFSTDRRGVVEPTPFRACFNPLQVDRGGEPAIVFRKRIEGAGLRIEYVAGDFTPAEMRARWLARLAALSDVEADAARVFTSRAELRWEAPSQERSSEFLTNGVRHAQAVEGELAILEEGRDPYRSRLGDLWRTHAHGDRDLPLRLFAPASLGEALVPVVVAFHGAGGDESFFFELAGNGLIKKLASDHGCLVVAPFTPYYLATPTAFDSLVDALAADYPIDRARIYLIGHSLGATTVARLVAERGERIHAAVCVAGFRAVPKDGPPVLVIQGELDPIVRAERVAKSVRDSKDADVESIVLEDMGHTLLLQRAVNLAFQRWFD